MTKNANEYLVYTTNTRQAQQNMNPLIITDYKKNLMKGRNMGEI